jgi:hypothetical protein
MTKRSKIAPVFFGMALAFGVPALAAAQQPSSNATTRQHPDSSQNAADRAARMQLFRNEASKMLGMLENGNSCTIGYGASDTDQLLEYVRYDYKSAGVTVNQPLAARIKAAGIHAHKVCAEYELSALEKNYLPSASQHLPSIEAVATDIRTNFKEAGIPVSIALDSRIKSAMALAYKRNATAPQSQPEIPKAVHNF